MKNTITILVLVTAIAFCFPQALPGDEITKNGVLLNGRYIGPEKEIPMEPVGQETAEDGGSTQNASLLENLPVIDPDLIEQALQMDPLEFIRVIIFLDYQPHDVIAAQIGKKYSSEIESIRQKARAINARLAKERKPDSPTDSENYENLMLKIHPAEKEAMRDTNERYEAHSQVIQREITAKLKAEVASSQAGVRKGIEQLGGKVEFGTIAGNAIIAIVPAGNVKEIADIKNVARVTVDRLREQHLNNADTATKVTYSGGLWDNGQDGGLFDPAVLDSGTDLNHPGLEADTNRENHWSWYLVAASAHPDYDDYAGIDDRNGHGTHVMGIVGSYGTTTYPDHLGMAFGIDKAVHLKAGFLKTNGRGSMYDSDAMRLVDRALFHQSELLTNFGTNDFLDDVDGINLSYGGDSTTDESDYSRFWDSVVSGYPDIVVTLSAGNSGPNNTVFSDPACSYNTITVASVNDQNTLTRDDDTIAFYSTRGPTSSGRRKPDIAAPGSNISSSNTFWEIQNDYINKSGTSMAAPIIQGLAMDLMDAGVTDEMEIKALLINHAQKNEPGVNFESDPDGWSPAYGWGYVNAWAAYYHRSDVDTYMVTERDTTGDYILLSGQMRDEGAGGEGRDRATMVWNRHATYTPHAYPTTYHVLSDLNLRLYQEANNSLIDTDLTSHDNAHQVRINSGAPVTDVVIKAYAWSTDFAHGGTTESFALATEENFTQVNLPDSFSAFNHGNPSEMEPNEIRDFRFSVRNDSDIACHSNQMNLVLPAGWTKISGTDPYAAGDLDSGETSTIFTWRLRAQATEQNDVRVSFNHTHNSYGEYWGPFNWGDSIDVRRDTTAPTPNPMTWATEPYAISTSSVRMVATTATDLHGPVEYNFWRGLSSGGTPTDLGYDISPTYTDSGLSVNTQYRYWVRTRDSAITPNYSAYSVPSDEYTDIEASTGINFGTVTAGSIWVRSNNTPSNLTSGSSGLCLYNITKGTNSGWQQTNDFWISSSLTPNTAYTFRAGTRNGDANATPLSPSASRYTLANVPGVAGFTGITQTSIRANWTANGNPAGTGYYCENITAGTHSGWITGTFWDSTGLSPGTAYTFRVRAINDNGITTTWVTLGTQSTQSYDAPVIDGIVFDECISECPGCPDSHINVTAHDPASGTLSYAWTPLNGGNVTPTSGAVVDFDPPDNGGSSGHPCPYNIQVQVTSSVSGLITTQIVPIMVKLTGDTDGNGVVNIIDKVAVRNAFGSTGPDGWIPADVNCDGVVNILDKVNVRNQFGQSGCICP
jgi:serine protease AprX